MKNDMTLLTLLTLSIFLIAFVVSIISKCQEANKNRTHFQPFARKCQSVKSVSANFYTTGMSFPKISRQIFDYLPKLVDTLPNFVDTFLKK